MARHNLDRPLPADDPTDAALTEEALAELDSGMGIPLADIKAWVESWGTDDELPPPEARRFR
ncbi:CopG family transcriptional regulator [Aerophototrophica crusticola]|uniref:CopG family transcriptional regulator n=1 Tax=Aerophototrophica crusticola TaxID=1709002 RepID=A0A858R3A0_9PROT|nr:CopG family transcriptional regulator [Rhodospirillaceae bacterium B3]